MSIIIVVVEKHHLTVKHNAKKQTVFILNIKENGSYKFPFFFFYEFFPIPVFEFENFGKGDKFKWRKQTKIPFLKRFFLKKEK